MNDEGAAAAEAAAMLPPTSSANSFPGNGRKPHLIPADENEHQSADLAAASRRVRIVDEIPPLSSIEQKPSGISSTSSSLSDGIDGSNTAQGDGGVGTPSNNNPTTSVGGDLSTAIESDPATKAADKKAAEAKAKKAEQQKHKKKNSLKSIMKKRPASSSGESRESLAQSSSSSALSSSRAGNSSQSRTSIGWGWFEHNSSNVLADSTKAPQEGDRSKSGKSSKKKKKKGGMLQGFSSAILGEQIEVPINQNGE